MWTPYEKHICALTAVAMTFVVRAADDADAERLAKRMVGYVIVYALSAYALWWAHGRP